MRELILAMFVIIQLLSVDSSETKCDNIMLGLEQAQMCREDPECKLTLEELLQERRYLDMAKEYCE